MRSYRTLIILAVVSAALAVPVCTTLAKAPRAVVGQGFFYSPIELFPGTKYDNYYTRQAAATADGAFLLEQPASKKWIAIWVTATGLVENATYRVYIDETGIIPGDVSSTGGSKLKGTFTTDASGNGAFYYEALDLLPDIYPWSVQINRVIIDPVNGNKNYTVLQTENLNFEIQP